MLERPKHSTIEVVTPKEEEVPYGKVTSQQIYLYNPVFSRQQQQVLSYLPFLLRCREQNAYLHSIHLS